MCNFSFIAVCARARALHDAFVEIPSPPIMNKNITSGYSGVKLLRETYTLESPRDPADTPGGLIRRSHAILFAEGYTFVRIGHVRVESDDFMQTSIISRRRHRRLRRVLLTPTTRSFPEFPFSVIRYTCPVKEIAA